MKRKPKLIKEVLEKYDQCFKFIYNRVGDEDVAKDILQEVYYKVFKAIIEDQYEEQQKLWPYLQAVMNNTIASYRRKLEHQEEVFKNESGYEVHSVNLLTENNFLITITMEEVMKIVSSLGPEIVKVFNMVYEGYSRKEIAEETGKSLEEVHFIMDHSRKKLRKWRDKNL